MDWRCSADDRRVVVAVAEVEVVPVSAVPVRPSLGRPTAVIVVLAALLAPLVPSMSSAATGAPAVSGSKWWSAGHLDRGLSTAGTGLTRVLVTAEGGVRAAADAVRSAGGRVGADLPLVDGVAASVPADHLAGLAATTGVRAVTADRAAHFTGAGGSAGATTSTFAGPDAVGAAWATGNRGRGVGIAVLDTGVSPVADLTGRLVHGPDLSGEGSTVDTHGHGTVMAGVAAGSGASSAAAGTGPVHTGVAPEATVVAVKVAGRDGAVDVSTILQAMHWVSAYKDQFGIRVLNLSWGTSSTQEPAVDPLNHAVQRLWQQGVVVVVAAGNAGPHGGTITKPADDPMVLSVGAYDDKGDTSPRNDTVTTWSSRGPTAAGLAKPDLVAPGRTLVATRSPGSDVEADNPRALVGAGYIKGSGTSQAAAVVSGLAALVLAEHPTWTPDQVKRVLTRTATPLPSAGRTEQGAGRVRLAAALTADPGPATWQTPTATGLGSLEASRGDSHVQVLCPDTEASAALVGERDTACEAWDAPAWTGSKWTGSKWTGSKWTGSKWTGSKWTGDAWRDATWTGSKWTGGDWTGAAWSGDAWTGSTWTGSKWTGATWTGATWAGSSWPGATWTGSKWTGSKWTGSKWTGSKWTGSKWTGSKWTGSGWTSAETPQAVPAEGRATAPAPTALTQGDDFLTAFWGQNPGPGLTVLGESNAE